MWYENPPQAPMGRAVPAVDIASARSTSRHIHGGRLSRDQLEDPPRTE